MGHDMGVMSSYSPQLSSSHSINMIGHTVHGLGSESPYPSFLAALQGGSPFQVLYDPLIHWAPNLGGLKSVDSGIVIGYQVDEFTKIWSKESFVA